MSAQLQRFNINFRPAVPAEAELVKAANTAPMPAAVYLRGAALAGHALLAAGCRLLEDGSLLVPGPGGVLVQLRPAEIIAVAKRLDFLQGIGQQSSSGHTEAAPAAPAAAAVAPRPAPVKAVDATPEPAPVPAEPPAPAPARQTVTGTAMSASEAAEDSGGDSERNQIASTALRSLGLGIDLG